MGKYVLTHARHDSRSSAPHTHGCPDPIWAHPSYTGTDVITWDVFYLLYLCLSLRIDPHVRAASIKPRRAERQINPEWYPRPAAGAGGGIRTIWYSYAQHLTHKHYLWAGWRCADMEQVMKRNWEAGGKRGDLKVRGLKATDGWMRWVDNRWEFKGGVTRKRREETEKERMEKCDGVGGGVINFPSPLPFKPRTDRPPDSAKAASPSHLSHAKSCKRVE